MSRLPVLFGLVPLVALISAERVSAQAPAASPVLPPASAPAPSPPVLSPSAAPTASPPTVPTAAPPAAAAPPVMAAEQVAPAVLTGLLGQGVFGPAGTDLGRIVNLLVDGQGRPRAVVVDVGGFMGVGNRKVAVAWSALRFAEGEKGPVVSIAITPDRVNSWADYIAGRPVAILGAPAAEP